MFLTWRLFLKILNFSGKRSARSENTVQIDPETNLAVSIYDGLSECVYREECLSALRLLLNDE